MILINYYKVLDINQKASIEDIKKAYRKKALKYHPDVNKHPTAHDLFIEIHEAFEILSDPIKRTIYDDLLLPKEMVVDLNNPSSTKEKAQSHQDANHRTNTNYEDWVKKARDHAERNSSMTYEKFKENLNELIETTRKIAGWGCFTSLSILGVMGLYGFFVGLSQYLKHERSDLTFLIGIGLFIFLGIPGILVFYGQFKGR